MSSPPAPSAVSPPPTPPASEEASRATSPGRSSIRNRMSAMRRTSTGLFSKATSVVRKSDSKGDLKVDPAATSTSPPENIPSPVPESPAGEAAAEHDSTGTGPHGPSPLARSAPGPERASAEPSISQVLTPPQAASILVPMASTASPPPEAQKAAPPQPAPTGAGTQQLAAFQPAPANSGTQQPAAPQLASTDAGIQTGAAAPSTSGPPDTVVAAGLVESPERVAVALPIRTAPQEPTIEKRSLDYFAAGDEDGDWSRQKPPATEVVAESAHAPDLVASVNQGHAEATPARTTDAQAFAWKGDLDMLTRGRSGSVATGRSVPQTILSEAPGMGGLSNRPSKSSVASSYGQVIVNPSRRRVAVSVDDGDGKRGRSPGPSVRIAFEDPFADPIEEESPTRRRSSVKRKALSPIESVNSSAPDMVAPLKFPLPPQRDVIASRPPQSRPTGYALGDSPVDARGAQASRDTDERRPLMLGSSRSSTGTVKGYAAAKTNVPFPAPEVTSTNAGVIVIGMSGWTEYTLPDHRLYYAHVEKSVVADIDLRNSRKLQVITEYVNSKLPDDLAMPPSGWELWLRDADTTGEDVKLMKCWVNHGALILSNEPPPSSGVPDRVRDEDRLDMQYRYWTYVEAHPAHVPLSSESRAEALDALKLSYADSLLPASRPAPPPFTSRESQELIKLLESFDKDSREVSLVQTWIVARVLLRIAQWKQHHFRPDKPLPQDSTRHAHRWRRRTPLARAVLDVLIACLCLGLPYLFADRSRHRRVDVESGIRSAGPMLIVGACACILAAFVLSASVTFVSLPGLCDVCRVAGLVSIAFSASSMVSAVVALFRYKAEVEHSAVRVGNEDRVTISRRSILMSLPVAFLIWAIAAFVTGVVLYYEQGITTIDIASVYPFASYSHWMTVGILGGMGSVLFIAATMSRSR